LEEAPITATPEASKKGVREEDICHPLCSRSLALIINESALNPGVKNGTSAEVFSVVADFNPEVQRLYEQVGYKQVGVIPNLYKRGVTEHLMMKEDFFD
jgi:hypothetical protein